MFSHNLKLNWITSLPVQPTTVLLLLLPDARKYVTLNCDELPYTSSSSAAQTHAHRTPPLTSSIARSGQTLIFELGAEGVRGHCGAGWTKYYSSVMDCRYTLIQDISKLFI